MTPGLSEDPALWVAEAAAVEDPGQVVAMLQEAQHRTLASALATRRVLTVQPLVRSADDVVLLMDRRLRPRGRRRRAAG
jgi:hypothetical protein